MLWPNQEKEGATSLKTLEQLIEHDPAAPDLGKYKDTWLQHSMLALQQHAPRCAPENVLRTKRGPSPVLPGASQQSGILHMLSS